MTDIATRVYGPAQPGATDTTLYTVAADFTLILRNIHVCNTTASDATLSLAINGTAATAANCLLSAIVIPAYGTYDWSGFLVINEAETLNALQGTASALTVTISGVVVSNE